MAGLNKVILAGRLVADPELRYTKNEKAVAHFCVAINKIKSENADFINCVAWNGLAKICGDYLKKGRLVAVEGRLSIRSYKDKNESTKQATEVIVDNMQMLDSKFHQAAEKAGEKEELVKI